MLNTIYMNSTIFYKQCLVYIFFTSTLFFGFYLGEDTAGGAIYDYNIHKKTIVETIDDAIKVLKTTNLDGVIINDYYVSK